VTFPSPDASFVIDLARGGPPSAADAPAPEPLDASRALEIARRHRLDSLCGWMARHLTAAPGSALARFTVVAAQSWKRTTRANLKFIAQLGELESEFLRHGISGLYFKGPWLATSAYPALGTRPIGDIDVCFSEGEYEPALDALARVGYQPDHPLPASGTAAVREAHYKRQLRFSAEGRCPVELHFRMVNMGPPAPEELWVQKTARAFEAAKTELRAPGPAAMLLHLLIHANQHGFGYLGLLHDIRWQLEAESAGVDVELLFDAIDRLRVGSSAYFGLQLARDLAGAVVPESWLEKLRPSSFASAVFRRVWRLDEVSRLTATRGRQSLEAPLFYLLQMGRTRDKLRYVGGVVTAAARGIL
jgi:hypothetical protein